MKSNLNNSKLPPAPTIVFSIRREPDIDNIAPVIYRMARDRAASILILCLNPFFDLTGDCRFNFLKREYNVPIQHIHEYYSPSILHSFIRSVFLNNISLKKTCGSNSNLLYKIMRFPARALQSIINRISENIFLNKKLFYTEEWAGKLLKLINPSVLVFDYVHPAIPIVDVLLTESKKLGIKSIFLPHGVPLFPDAVLRELERGRGYVFAPIAASDPEVIVVPHSQSISAFTRNNVDPKKLHVLGSARFCREWTDILHDITNGEKYELPINSNKLNVLYIERGNDRYGNKKDVVRETFMKISGLAYVNFIIKPHPRSHRIHFQDLPESINIAYDYDSINLCRWADVVICLASSIAIEVLIQNKVLICPKFFDELPLIMDEMGACWRINSYEELLNAFRKILDDPSYRPYTQENVDKFLVEVVYGGKENRDVLGDYENLILQESGVNDTK